MSKKNDRKSSMKLDWSGIRLEELEDENRPLLHVYFENERGEVYDWVPKWEPIRELFDKSANTELVNFPRSKYLTKFSKVARNVISKISDQPLNVRKERGPLDEIRDGDLVLYSGRVGEKRIQPGFEISRDFMRKFIGKWVTCLVVQGLAVEIETTEPDKEGKFWRYPIKEED